MAKVYGVIVGLCFVFSSLINNCNSFKTRNIDFYTYDTISSLPKLDHIDAYSSINNHLRYRRQTSKEDSLDKSPKNPPEINQKNISSNNNETIVHEPATSINDDNVSNNNNTLKPTYITPSAPISTQQTLLGANGTGQRKDYGSTKIPLLTIKTNSTESDNKKLQLLYPASGGGKPIKVNGSQDDDGIFEDFDKPDVETNEKAAVNNITLFKEDHYHYYNSTTIIDRDRTKQYWENLKNLTVNSLLSKSHRRAITVQLSFDFPFYGHPVRNVTVATGGFLYTGEYVHSWLAATQYIAPLMANFDTSISNDSFVRFHDNGTAFTVLWEKVSLQDRQDDGTFTFSVTLHKSGDIVFVYYSLPILIELILDDKHPVKIGLSDAYIIDKTIFFARRKTIYEYHRVNFDSQDISNNTIISLTALPTCLSFTDCQTCIESLSATFKCTWCPALNKCSTGTDRKRQDWLQKGCDRTMLTNVSLCAPIGTRGNNYGSQQEVEVKDVSNVGDKWTTHGDEHGQATIGNGGGAALPVRVSSKENDGDSLNSAESSIHESASGFGMVLGLFIPIILIMTLAVWIFYAYRNPHTKSGQLLIQYRPSQWSWRRGEARYTAATIHM